MTSWAIRNFLEEPPKGAKGCVLALKKV